MYGCVCVCIAGFCIRTSHVVYSNEIYCRLGHVYLHADVRMRSSLSNTLARSVRFPRSRSPLTVYITFNALVTLRRPWLHPSVTLARALRE